MTKKKNTKGLKTDNTKPAAVAVPDVDGNALLGFLAKRAGGMDKATRDFIRDNTAALVKSGATFGAIMDKANAEGWGDMLAATPVKSVLATPAAPRARSKGNGGGRTAALAKLQADILDKLAGAPPMTAADVAAEVEGDRKRVTRILVKLATDGKVNAEGSRRFRTYSVA